MTLAIVPETAQYDPTRNDLSANQEEASKLLFSLVQEIRLQKSATDADSPGSLSAQEIITIAMTKVPGAADAIMRLLSDSEDDARDFSNVANAVKNQLFA